MNEDQQRRKGRLARVAAAAGCSEGRVCTLTIGLVLALVLAVGAWPAARVELIGAVPPASGVGQGPAEGAEPAPSTPASPSWTSSVPPPTAAGPPETTSSTPDTSAPNTTPPATSPPSEAEGPPPRDPGYVLPPQLEPLEAAVSNLVRDGCSRLSLVNVVVGLLPAEVRDPISLGPVLGLLSQVYVACDTVAFPPTRIVCVPDMQVNLAILRSPLSLFFQSVPRVVGHAVELLTAPTDVVFGLLGIDDPLLAPTLMDRLGCVDLEQ